MKLPIITYPDKRLKIVSNPVKVFDAELHTFLDDMYETMMATNGLGLAAIQVDRPIQVLILNIPNEEGEQYQEGLLEIINPQITFSDGSLFFQEGCLSVPGFYEEVERYEKVIISYLNRHGEGCSLEADELLSVAVQHEMDHLAGKLFIEKLSYSRRKKFEKEYKKAQKEKKRQ